MPTNLDDAIDDQRETLVRILTELIAAKTENPPDVERPAAEVVMRYLDAWGIGYETFEKVPDRTNVIGTVGRGEPTLLAACHLDVVPAGEGWSSDPFVAKIEGDRLIGRGSSDNKGQLAACLVAAQALKQHEDALKGQLMLAAVADEERGSAYGLDYLVDECGLTADCAIIPDVLHNMNMIDVAEKGLLFLKITSFGKQAHGSTPEHGVNAVWNMVDFLNRLRQNPIPTVEHEFLSPATLNLGMMNGGSAPNMVPAKCEVMLDIRYPAGQSKADIVGLVQRVIDETAAANPLAKLTVEVDSDLPSSEVPSDLPIIPIIQRHTEAVVGRKPMPLGMSGTTVVKQLVAKGVPSVGFAPGDDDQPHTANESVSIQELLDFGKVMARICLDYLG